jgi:hypothetical protein
MLIAFPVLPLLASTMVSPGRSSPSRSARSIMYLAMRALIDPEGLRYSSLTQIPSTMISGVLPIASRIVPPPGRASPAAGSRAACAAAAGSRAPRAPERVPIVPVVPAAYVPAAGHPPSRRAGEWFAGPAANRRPCAFLAKGITAGPLAEWVNSIILTVEGADHAWLRRLVGQAFTPRAVAALRPVVPPAN